MKLLETGYSTGEDHLFLWLPVVCKHVIDDVSPLRAWRTPGGFERDHSSAIAVVVSFPAVSTGWPANIDVAFCTSVHMMPDQFATMKRSRNHRVLHNDYFGMVCSGDCDHRWSYMWMRVKIRSFRPPGGGGGGGGGAGIAWFDQSPSRHLAISQWMDQSCCWQPCLIGNSQRRWRAGCTATPRSACACASTT